ncbi:MAG: ATP phosphoribosyltransferase [Clostridia bacterium]|nr:ATP phosphoribosyltransferase [Clostridia bacterium]
MGMITIALAKGRLADLSIDLMEKAGVDCAKLKGNTRKLIFNTNKDKYRFVLVKPTDVPTYVEYGAADVGICGKDTLMEEERDLYEILDLDFGKCKLAVAGMPELKNRNIVISNKRVATKYPNVASKYYKSKDETVEVIKLNGSVELAPILGLAEVIVDIVESGRTLKENGLVVLEDICDVSARLVVNRASLKTKSEDIKMFISQIRRAMEVE